MKTTSSTEQSGQPTIDQIVSNYQPIIKIAVFKIIKNKMDAEEVIQDVTMKAISKLNQFNNAKGSFAAWLATIAKNTSLDFIKSKSYRQWNNTTDKIPEGITRVLEPDLRLQLCARFLSSLFNILDETQAKIVTLRYIENRDYTEIALIMGKSIEHTRVLNHRALEKLRKLVVCKKEH